MDPRKFMHALVWVVPAHYLMTTDAKTGKSTTFSMLTGEIAPTRGELVVDGIDVVREPDKAKRLVGYCPQFDALWDKLTAREHLQLYGAVKGVPKDKMEREVNSILGRMGLNEFADKMAGGE